MAWFKIWKSGLSFTKAVCKIYLDVREEENTLKVEYIVKVPSEFNFGLSKLHFCKHPVALSIQLVPSFMEQGKLADHLSKQGRKSFYVEHRFMRFGIDLEKVSRSEKECSCFEGNILVPEGPLNAMQGIIV